MTLTTELVVFQHLKENFSPKIVQKFCKELNFDPPELDQEAVSAIQQILEKFNEPSKDEKSPKNNLKKRKAEEEAEPEYEEEEAPKKPKMDLSNTECYKCGQTGHMSRQCPQNESQGGGGYNDSDMTCYNCNKTGHMSKNCPDKFAGMSCYNCGKNGHLSRECPDKASGMKCYNCNGTGHLSRDCSEKNGANSKMLCYNCQSVGHMARDCDKPRVQRQQNGRGGGRGGNWKPRNFGSGANNEPLGAKKTFD